DTYAVDLVEWFVSWGRRPVMRLLPHQRDVLAAKHLRGALHKLTAARLADADRARLTGLVGAAVRDGEHRLRERLRPEVNAALPFGGAYRVLRMWEEVEGLGRGKPPEPPLEETLGGTPDDPVLARSAVAAHEAAGVDPYLWGALGIFFLLLLHVAPFRRGVL